MNRPSKYGPSIIEPKRGVIHAMGEYIFHDGKWLKAVDFLEVIGLSAHVLVEPSGQIIRCRNNNQGAWHAKAQGHNYKSLGIEFLVEGKHSYDSFCEAIKGPYLTPEQYEAGVKFVRKEWVKEIGILDYVRHSMIDPLNKQDPGDGFPFNDFLKDIGVII